MATTETGTAKLSDIDDTGLDDSPEGTTAETTFDLDDSFEESDSLDDSPAKRASFMQAMEKLARFPRYLLEGIKKHPARVAGALGAVGVQALGVANAENIAGLAGATTLATGPLYLLLERVARGEKTPRAIQSIARVAAKAAFHAFDLSLGATAVSVATVGIGKLEASHLMDIPFIDQGGQWHTPLDPVVDTLKRALGIDLRTSSSAGGTAAHMNDASADTANPIFTSESGANTPRAAFEAATNNAAAAARTVPTSASGVHAPYMVPNAGIEHQPKPTPVSADQPVLSSDIVLPVAPSVDTSTSIDMSNIAHAQQGDSWWSIIHNSFGDGLTPGQKDILTDAIIKAAKAEPGGLPHVVAGKTPDMAVFNTGTFRTHLQQILAGTENTITNALGKDWNTVTLDVTKNPLTKGELQQLQTLVGP